MGQARGVDPQEVSAAFGLGAARSISDPVARGELGEVRRLETERGRWAIKQVFDPGDPADDELSTTFHRRCWEAGIPTPEPIRGTAGSFVVDVAGEQVRAYGWVDLEDPDRDLDPVQVGRLLAALHAVRVPPAGVVDPWFEAAIGRRGWRQLLKASRAAGAPYADRLKRLVPALVEVESVLTPMVPVQTCHLDLWSDNLRRGADGALWLIDFDNAGPADPSRELAMVLFEFGVGDRDRVRALHEAYLDAGGPGRITGRDSFALTVAQLHHIGHRHARMWLAARDDVARQRSLAGLEEFLAEPLLVPDLDRMLGWLE